MSYTIQSGDSLWKIAKQQYNLTSNKDIQAKIAEIAKENNITDINLIISGSTLTLPGLEATTDTSGSVFADWTNSSSNYNNLLTGNKVDDFQMFDYYSLGNTPEARGEKYGQEIEKFAQNYINQYDTNGDKNLDFNEFVNMQMESFEDMFGESLNLSSYELLSLFGDQFGQLSSIGDNDNNFNRASEQNFTTGTINAKQFAAFFGVVDGQDGLVDGSMTYENYNYTPQMSGFEDALDNYYDDFFNN